MKHKRMKVSKILEDMIYSALKGVGSEVHIDVKNRRAKIYKFKKNVK